MKTIRLPLLILSLSLLFAAPGWTQDDASPGSDDYYDKNFFQLNGGMTLGIPTGNFNVPGVDASQTVTAEIGAKLNPNERATFIPLVSDVTTSGSSLAPTVSWTNPDDMTDVDRIRVRFLQTDGDLFSSIYEMIITDLATESITVPEGFLFAGDYQLRVQLEDLESIDRVLDGVPVTRESTLSRSVHISDFTAVQLPLPGTVSLLLAGLVAFGWLGRKRPLAKHG